MANKKEPAILVIDIETRPTLAFVWSAYKVNISPDQVVSPGGTLCVGAKWFGSKDTLFASEWEDGHQGMIEKVHGWLSEADALVTFNGDSFDITRLQGEFLLCGLTPPPPPTSIDLIKTVRKLGLFMNRLAFVGPFFDVGDKVRNEGFPLWVKVLAEDVNAQNRMKKYCLGDVRLTERLYKRIRPFIKNHPHLGTKKSECGACGSTSIQKRGFRRTKYFLIQRTQCQSCGAWSEGARKKIV